MLTTLHIENYALIRESDIRFDGGFAVITGETGAGKSILLGALGLLLGQRADTQVLQDKERKCVVEAVFDVAGLGLEPLFEAYEADYDDTLILRREILPSAKSRAFVNDSPASLQLLKELGPHIIDIHSQHQTLTLTESNFQTRLLDSLSERGVRSAECGAETEALGAYRASYAEYVRLKRQLEQLTAQDAENTRTLDYNRFLFDELSAARLQSGEQAELEEEQRLMEHTETIKEALDMLCGLCGSDSDDGAMTRLTASRSQLARVAGVHAGLEELHGRLDSSIIELQDILSEAEHLNDSLQYSPQRQAEVAERLDLIYRLQKKHGVQDIDSLLAIQQRLDEQLQAADSLDDRIREVMEQVDQAFAAMQSAAERLTQSRRQAAQLLEQQIPQVLSQLGMGQARMAVEILPAAEYGPLGHDAVRLLFNANKGGAMRPLAEVASGGELSRLMLAVKSVVSQRSLLPTIIFDEIDSGVSGDISVAVGAIMRSMASRMQVIAISHLPQIAAKACQHLKVAKGVETDRTVSRIRQLSPDERVTEIAVMLSSNPPTPSALQTAAELMNNV